MTEQEAIAYVTREAQTNAYPEISPTDVAEIVGRNMRATVWEADKAYKIGDKVQPTTPNGHFYQCIFPGTSAAEEPDWQPSINYPHADGDDLIWEECATDFDGNLYITRNAIHECWKRKASMSANQFDVSIDSQKWNRSQIYAHCLEMANIWQPIE